MNPKKRKIFRRIGAGLMLGLSLVGFGSQVAKGQGKLMPKKVRHVRKQEQEGAVAGNQQLVDTVEEEAKTALKQQQDVQQKQQQDMQSNLSLSQTVFRYSALAVWAIGVSLFFTSLVFNAPFSLGKKFMAALPGNPHLASLSLGNEEELVNDEMKIDLKVDSAGDQVYLIKAVIEYSDEELLLQEYEILSNQVKKIHLDEKTSDDVKKLVFMMESDGGIFDEEDALTLNFLQRKEAGTVDVGIIQDDSLILSKKEEKTENILGVAKNVSVFLGDQ